ncbi:N-acetylglucosamine kinase-like BadF-type ATPase [Streptosporangium becharense]|uniref:N-acetylglucosamine kinase-like BadF-type ATPase n=1 Tax=Streptosporangium becharense TaxID=1816182 RepID=A0A7W9ILY3_9ACTN|nr:BadF/BadG/BcrA/BcrD ATPase family protein [Streptosporangium becharense]MBB2910293.1 N-acetylglucosamine kinase-like BadF-type ATPase [Streptosporangium becharense]MBB5823036.1 N-acetylglucosamine kinase-like BadF-type ATPase [Streptosporangium becharense]
MSAVAVGVDVGGTKTHWRAVSSHAVVADRIVPSVLGAGIGDLAEWLAAGLRELEIPCDALGVGAHGCDSPALCRRLREELGHRLGAPVRVMNDAHLLPYAAGEPGAIGVIAGTGSVAAGTLPGGEPLLAGGWGWALGDEGSAAGLVREAVRAVLRDHDAGLPADELATGLLAALHADEVPALSQALASAPGAEEWGRHAQVVFAAAEAGSRTAARVVEEGGQALAALVETLISRGARASAVVAAGGVITKQPRLFAALADAVAARHPDLPVTLLATDPVAGAVRLAQELLTT